MNIASNGIRLHVADQGKGALAIVFLHGWGASTRTWEHVIAALAGHGGAGVAIQGVVGDMAGLAQGLAEIGRCFLVVFDQEDAHSATDAVPTGSFAR